MVSLSVQFVAYMLLSVCVYVCTLVCVCIYASVELCCHLAKDTGAAAEMET